MAQKLSSEEEHLEELYQSLPLLGEHSIRLLELAPGKKDAEIRVRLRVVNLDSNPDYEALSYTWGDPKTGRSILVNDGYPVSVTDNLFNALRALRQCSEPRNLWVDRTCINQLDITERGRQVAFMGQIYAKATCVNVWLGEPATWTSPISFYHLLVAASAWLLYRRTKRRYSREPWYDDHCEEVWRGFKSSVRNHGRILGKALKDTEPQWWTRVWVVQEFALAAQVFLCAGRSRYLYSQFWLGSLGTDVDMSVVALKRSIDGMQRLKPDTSSLERSEAHIAQFPNKDLLECLYRMRYKNATDRRDFVYSLRGLINDNEADMLIPDYESPVSEIYAKATFASIVNRQDFDILKFVKLRPDPFEDSQLPSWSIDFADQKDHTGIVEFGSAIDSKNIRFTYAYLSKSTRHLTIGAYVFGAVDETKTSNWSSYDLELGSRELDLVMDAAKQFRSSLSNTNARTSVAQALALKRSDESSTDILGSSLSSVQEQFTGTEKLFLNAALLWNYLTGVRVTGPEPSVPNGNLHNYLHSYSVYADWFGSGAAVFVTSDGVIGFGPSTLAKGDVIVQVCSQRPFIALRWDGEYYTFQGQLWIHGFMDERIINRWKNFDVKEDRVVLK